jgi:hypothetical protein
MKALKVVAKNICFWMTLPLIAWGIYGAFHGLEALLNWADTYGSLRVVALLAALTFLAVVFAIATTIWDLWNNRLSMRAARAVMVEASVLRLSGHAEEDEDQDAAADDDAARDGEQK